MKYEPGQHHRRSIRLARHDYAQPGAYFVTMVTHGRECLFGDVSDGQMTLNRLGCIIRNEWEMSAIVRDEIELDAFVVMPNHVHGIIIIKQNVEAAGVDAQDVGATGRATGRAPLRARGPGQRSLGAFVAGFKSAATKRINVARNSPGAPVWQRNYFEHVIRDEVSLGRIREYIVNNPQQWQIDRENPLRSISPVLASAPMESWQV